MIVIQALSRQILRPVCDQCEMYMLTLELAYLHFEVNNISNSSQKSFQVQTSAQVMQCMFEVIMTMCIRHPWVQPCTMHVYRAPN